jgi:hypothetical protein
MVGVPKKRRKCQVFFKLFFINNIIWTKNWIFQIKIIFVLVIIFHICTSLCIKILFQTNKSKKWSNKTVRTIRFIFHDSFLHMWLTLWVTNSKPNEYKQSTKWPKVSILFLTTSKKEICCFQNFHDLSYNQKPLMNMAKNRCEHYLSIKKLTSIAFLFIHLFFWKQNDIINLKDSKIYLYILLNYYLKIY